jgi:hypothetical protein
MTFDEVRVLEQSTLRDWDTTYRPNGGWRKFAFLIGDFDKLPIADFFFYALAGYIELRVNAPSYMTRG